MIEIPFHAHPTAALKMQVLFSLRQAMLPYINCDVTTELVCELARVTVDVLTAHGAIADEQTLAAVWAMLGPQEARQ